MVLTEISSAPGQYLTVSRIVEVGVGRTALALTREPRGEPILSAWNHLRVPRRVQRLVRRPTASPTAFESTFIGAGMCRGKLSRLRWPRDVSMTILRHLAADRCMEAKRLRNACISATVILPDAAMPTILRTQAMSLANDKNGNSFVLHRGRNGQLPEPPPHRSRRAVF